LDTTKALLGGISAVEECVGVEVEVAGRSFVRVYVEAEEGAFANGWTI
jgi:hypothetical protein